MRRDVPLRRSLLLRLLAVSVLVSVCSIVATAWLTVRSTTVAIQQEQGQALADDARIYDELLGYAASHSTWKGADKTVRLLAQQTGHRVTLTTEDRRPVLDSDSGPSSLPAKPTAVIEPLAVDTALTAASSSDRIDPRAVGPFRLPRKERDELHTAALRTAACLRDNFRTITKIVDGPSGRPRVETPALNPDFSTTRCASPALDELTPTEVKALTRLNKLVNACLAHQAGPIVKVGLDFTWGEVTTAVTGDDRTGGRSTTPAKGSEVSVPICITTG
ncbi:hypothetical protein ACFQX6_33755 [Streptosporangium lutulentum]